MAEQAAEPRVPVARESASTGWAVGFIVFAGVMMVMLGVFHALEGLTAIFKDQFFVATPNYLYSVDVTTWGWIHLIGGIVVALAGFYVFSGSLWARVIGIVLAGLSAIGNFVSIPYYPIWSLLMIALAVFVIWALTAHGRDIAT
jgi:hypothetical protein